MSGRMMMLGPANPHLIRTFHCKELCVLPWIQSQRKTDESPSRSYKSISEATAVIRSRKDFAEDLRCGGAEMRLATAIPLL